MAENDKLWVDMSPAERHALILMRRNGSIVSRQVAQAKLDEERSAGNPDGERFWAAVLAALDFGQEG